MEVNLSPSLTADSDVDIYVKKPLLNDLFDLIGLPTSLHDPTISPQWPVPDEKLFTRYAGRCLQPQGFIDMMF